MLYGAETWALRKEDLERLERVQMAGISRMERRTNVSIRKAYQLEPLHIVMRRIRLRWLGHIERREADNIKQQCQAIVVNGKRPVGRPKKNSREVIEEDLSELQLKREDAQDRAKWRARIAMSGPTLDVTGKKGP